MSFCEERLGLFHCFVLCFVSSCVVEDILGSHYLAVGKNKELPLNNVDVCSKCSNKE